MQTAGADRLCTPLQTVAVCKYCRPCLSHFGRSAGQNADRGPLQVRSALPSGLQYLQTVSATFRGLQLVRILPVQGFVFCMCHCILQTHIIHAMV